MRTIMELFAKSPFQPLARHAEAVQAVVERLEPVVEAFLSEDWPKVRELHGEISRLEHEADKIKTEIRDQLPRSLFLPVDRGDLLRYLKEQDGIADAVEDIAVIASLRETRAPESVKEQMRPFVEQIVRTCGTWLEMAHALVDLQEAGFSGPGVAKVHDTIQTLSTQEWEADKLQADLARAIIAEEESLGAVSVLFLMRISGKLGSVANRAENTSDLLRLMLAR